MKNIPDVITMAPMHLECPNAGCELGGNGQKYKTPVMEAELALRMLDLHVQQNHVLAQGVTYAPATNRTMRERQKKPSEGTEMSGAYGRDLLNQWARFKRASGVSCQDLVDDLVLC